MIEQAGLQAFKQRPTARLCVGVTLITVSSLMGWPAVALAGCLAVEQRNAWIFFLGGPVVYGLSWVLWGVAMLVAGRDALRYAHLFLRWLTRRVAEWFLGPRGRQALLEAHGPADPPEGTP